MHCRFCVVRPYLPEKELLERSRVRSPEPKTLPLKPVGSAPEKLLLAA